MSISNSREFSSIQACSWPISDLPGISADDCQRLQALAIQSTRDLLRHSQTLESQVKLAQKLQLHLHHVQKWHALAELALVPSVGKDYCGLLLHAGVSSIAQLANLLPGHLSRQILRLHVSTLQTPDLSPNAGLVELWIRQAKQLQQRQQRATITKP
jgi:predicted RecB family nuclease